MQCPACKTEAPAESMFCPKCGQKFNGPATKFGDTAAPTKTASVRAAMTPGAAGTPDPDVSPEVLWEGNYSPKAMTGYWIFASVMTLVLIVVGIVVPLPITWIIVISLMALTWLWGVGQLVYQKISVSYQLTSQTFVHKHGVLSRTTDRIDVIDMDDISFTQGLLDRFLGVGTLRVVSSDVSHPKLFLPGIDQVEKVAGIFDTARRRERARRGIHIESI